MSRSTGRLLKLTLLTPRKTNSNSPILTFPDYKLPFHLFTDASNVGIGAVLIQPHNQQLLPIAYVSKSLDETQKNYSATKRSPSACIRG